MYPFQSRGKQAYRSDAPKKQAKTTGTTGTARTRERLVWQKKHLLQAEEQAKSAVGTQKMLLEDAKRADATASDFQQKTKPFMKAITNARYYGGSGNVGTLMRQRAAVQANADKYRKLASDKRKQAAAFGKRAAKWEKEATKMRAHVRKNTSILAQKLNTLSKQGRTG